MWRMRILRFHMGCVCECVCTQELRTNYSQSTVGTNSEVDKEGGGARRKGKQDVAKKQQLMAAHLI